MREYLKWIQTNIDANCYRNLVNCNGFLRFTSGVTPADLLVVNIVSQPFRPTDDLFVRMWFTQVITFMRRI